jgi:hypothetical protein
LLDIGNRTAALAVCAALSLSPYQAPSPLAQF